MYTAVPGSFDQMQRHFGDILDLGCPFEFSGFVLVVDKDNCDSGFLQAVDQIEQFAKSGFVCAALCQSGQIIQHYNL